MTNGSLSAFNFVKMASMLDEEQGISFQDKGETWDNAEDVKAVVDALNEKSTVHYLNLDGNTLGVAAAEAISKALKKHPEFRKALWKNLFTRRGISEIPQALKYLGNGLISASAKLTVLDLSDNALGPNGMRGLEELLRSPVCYSLQELYLHNCGLGPEGGRMLSTALMDLHKNAKAAGTSLHLRTFVAGRNRLENEGAQALSKTFKLLQTLEEITMPQNSIYHVGFSALADSFKANRYLRILNMNDNTPGSRGATKIAEAFVCTPLLREINFGDCLLKTDIAYQFAEALEENHEHLEVLDLSFNEINYDGGLVLVTAMKNKSKLRNLNLEGNSFGKKGREQIIAEMAKCKNPAALKLLEEGEEGNESDVENEGTEVSEYSDGECDESDKDGEEDYADDDTNDTTEEGYENNEDDYNNENNDDETAYVTTNSYTSKINDSANSNNNIENSSNVTKADVGELKGCTPADFCLSQAPCTLQQFDSLNTTDRLHAFQDIINQFTGDNHLLLLIFTTLKCGHLSQSSKAAMDLAVALIQATFDYAIKTNQESRVVEYYLKQLGLLRSEERFKSDYDMKSCRLALREALKNDEFANDNIKNTFKTFLDQLDV